MDQIEKLLHAYGPLAVFLGAGFEGQTAVIAGGFMAHLKLMSVWTVFFSAFAGTWLVDEALFIAGRRFRDHPFVVRTSATLAFAKALNFIQRYPVSYMIAFRFVVGLRLASPIAFGVSPISNLRFTALNVLSAVVWSAVFTLAGFWFGETLEAWLGHIKGLEHWLGLGLVALVVAFAGYHAIKWLIIWRRNRGGGRKTP
jgi:membrane protein DedA with SNARE-associated domain